ncbi:MAG TPA: TraB/GumN family protein [Sphingobium sp.]|uniref:TraB/GumN family protein n=1 Tax=unclassified Sphingobium TaxID=2611147 RepID=UPI000EDF3D9C|nr:MULTISPECIES: TraB/GumN family protein [unclassified Sphingobium]WIW89826.1 TraB/GumN family protein [Sphingobium sp. V4]HAF40543.1 TraB/GumN family protein [Sphingobium sp.]
MTIFSALLRGLSAALLLVGGVAQARPAATATPALWQVSDADTTIYLFGTVHVMKPGIDWFNGPVKSAFDRSDLLVLEIIEPDNPNELGATMGGMALAKDGVKLSDRLSGEARARYQAAMESSGLPWRTFDLFNPWMAGMALSVAPLARLGYKNDLGAEKILRGAAQAAGKPVDALETVEQQVGFFAGLPMVQQVQFLNATVDGLPEMEKEFGDLLTYWQSGQPDKLAKSMNESLEATPELAQVLLIGRNANWAKWIKARLEQPGITFVAVGAGHLAGKGSVQDQLKALGVASHRVKD